MKEIVASRIVRLMMTLFFESPNRSKSHKLCVPGVPKKVSPFQQFQRNSHCPVLNDVICTHKANLDSHNFSDFCSSKHLQNVNFPKFNTRENLEKIESLAAEICSISSMFYITGVKVYNHLSISQIGI